MYSSEDDLSYGLNLGWGGPIRDYIGFWGGPMKGYSTNLVQGSFRALGFHLMHNVGMASST